MMASTVLQLLLAISVSAKQNAVPIPMGRPEPIATLVAHLQEVVSNDPPPINITDARTESEPDSESESLEARIAQLLRDMDDDEIPEPEPEHDFGGYIPYDEAKGTTLVRRDVFHRRAIHRGTMQFDCFKALVSHRHLLAHIPLCPSQPPHLADQSNREPARMPAGTRTA